MLPAVMQWNLETSVEPLARLARLVGAATEQDDDETAAAKSVSAVRDLIASLGLPTQLRKLGPDVLTQADFDKIAEMTMELPHVITNPLGNVIVFSMFAERLLKLAQPALYKFT